MADFDFAIVSAVYSDGITLILPGETAPTTKRYKCNTSVQFQAGQRVKIIESSGTYVVEYPVGNPQT